MKISTTNVLALLLPLLLVASCNEKQDNPVSDTLNASKVTAFVKGDLPVSWDEKQTIVVLAQDEDGQVAFPVSEGVGTAVLDFNSKGLDLKPDKVYSAYCFLENKQTPVVENAKISLNVASQVQKGNGSNAHIVNSDCMVAVNSKAIDGCLSLEFEHTISLLHIKMKMPNVGIFNKVVLESNGNFVSKATFNLKDGAFSPVKYSSVQELEFEDVELVDKNLLSGLDIYMPILPSDLSGYSIVVRVFDKDGTCYTADLFGSNFLKGTIYSYDLEATKDMVHSYLPSVLITTPNNAVIDSKEVYVENSLFSLYQPAPFSSFCEMMSIKGRGNSTWTNPKKPYAIKFDKKQSLLSLPDDKSWVLLANYWDPTFVRNDVVFFIGNEMSVLDWTPHYQLVDLTLNGSYLGIYQLGEKVKLSKKRVNADILLEIDKRALTEEGARYFTVPHLENPVNVKDPDVEYDDDTYNYAKEYVLKADAALFAENFTDTENGWQKYMDIDSFVEWYVINEMIKNFDACIFYSSCYMNLSKDGKLKMGPLWDYDVAFGTGNGRTDWAKVPEGFELKERVAWYRRLFQDPVFVAKVKERFNYYYLNKQLMFDRIDAVASLLSDKVVYDNSLWGRITAKSASEERVKSAYLEKVSTLKTWFNTRLEWLKTNFESL